MNYPFENLVFEGGGIKGLAFCGALEVLERKGVMRKVKRLAGSSAGAITAGLLACGYTYDRISQKLQEKDFNDFRDNVAGSTLFSRGIRKIRGVWGVASRFGFHSGDDFYDWYGNLLQEAAGRKDVTFRDIESQFHKQLVITGTCLNRRETEYYSPQQTPEMPVRDAVRISMSLPAFFQPIQRDGDILVDGGVLNNYPIWVFDGGAYPGHPEGRIAAPNSATLGLKLLTPEELAEQAGRKMAGEIDDLKDFASALVDCLTTQIERLHIKTGDWQRTIAINTGTINTKQFDLSASEKQFLLDEGRKAAEQFFVAFDARL